MGLRSCMLAAGSSLYRYGAQPEPWGVRKSYKCSHAFAAYLTPASTGLASCMVRMSDRVYSSLTTEGHSSALPALGSTEMLSDGNLVSPPRSTSLK